MGRVAQATEASKNGAYVKDADKTPDIEFSQFMETRKRSIMSQELSKGALLLFELIRIRLLNF